MSDEIQSDINTLISTLKSVQLATLSPKQLPEISYAPYLKQHNSFFIFISDLATHTQNLKKHPHLSLMFIEDESRCQSVFARRRLILECQSTLIERNSEKWHTTLLNFEASHDSTIKVLKELTDFHLFELNAIKGNFVKGFGQAYHLSGKALQVIEQR